MVYDFDPEGNQLRVVQFTDYVGEKVRTLYPSETQLRHQWADPLQRAAIVALLASYGIKSEKLASAVNQLQSLLYAA